LSAKLAEQAQIYSRFALTADKDVRAPKEDTMPTYIALLKWTQQGISKVGSSAKRLDAGRKAFKKAGIEMKDVYLTMGRYDLVCVIEAPDDETYAKAILGLGSQGNVSTETLKAFSEDQFRQIIGSL
jgi:uncharacterized protein with GYD domain